MGASVAAVVGWRWRQAAWRHAAEQTRWRPRRTNRWPHTGHGIVTASLRDGELAMVVPGAVSALVDRSHVGASGAALCAVVRRLVVRWADVAERRVPALAVVPD